MILADAGLGLICKKHDFEGYQKRLNCITDEKVLKQLSDDK